MNKIEALNPQRHKNLRVRADRLADGAGHLVPVVFSEFRKLCIHYPIVFSKQADTGQFHCSVLLGLAPGDNVYKGAIEQCCYLPAHIQRQPFCLGETTDSGDYALCVDLNHPSIDATGEPVFVAAGKADHLAQAKQALAELMQGQAATKAFVDQLLAMQLLIPLSLEFTGLDGRSTQVRGLYTVDEQKLDELPATDLKRLQTSGYLMAIYLIIASQAQVYALLQRHNLRQAEQAA